MKDIDIGYLVGCLVGGIVAAISGPLSWVTFATAFVIYIPIALISNKLRSK